MDPLRYRNSPSKDKFNHSLARSSSGSGFEDTTASFKDSSGNKLSALKFPSEPQSPNEDVVINFQTDNATTPDHQTQVRTTTGDGHLLSRTTTMGHGQGERLVTPAEDIMPSNLLEEDIIMRLINNSVFYILRVNALSLILFGLLALAITWGISYLYAVGFLWAVDFFELLQMMTHSRRYRASIKSRFKRAMACISPVAKTLASAGSKGMLFAYYNSVSFPLVACVIPVALYEICSSISILSKSRQRTMKKIYLGLLIMKILLAASAIAAALKMENRITCEWKEAILGYWIVFAFVCGFTLVSVLCLVNRCCVFFFADSDQFQVYGIVWSMLILGGKGVLSCFLILTLQDSYDGNITADDVLTQFFIVMSYNLVMLLFTLGYYTEIENFFKDLAAIEDEYEHTQMYDNEMDTKENQPKTLQKIIVPKFLTKSSSTYYRVVTESEMQEARQKRKKRIERKREKEERERVKPKQIDKEPRRSNRLFQQKDYAKMDPNFKSTKNDMLNTIAETEQDKRTHITELDRRAALATRSSKREDKGKDFFATLTNKTGVLGIVPSVVKRLGLPFTSKKGYAEQEDAEEDGGRGPNFNQSCDFTAGTRPVKRTGQSLTGRLERKGRNQLGPKGLEALEQKLREIDLSQSQEEKNARERMIQSMYNKPEAGNFSAVFDQGISNDSSMVEDSSKPKSGENSMTQQCLICFDKSPDAVFMNCGHGGVCYECSVAIWKSTEECYLCRNKIVQVLQVDLRSKLEGDVIKVLSSTQMMNWEDHLEG